MGERSFCHQANWLSFKEARGKLGDPLSSLVLFRCKRHMVLSPRYLGQINKGVKETLEADLRLYCPKLYGVLVAYNNVSVLSMTGDMQDEAPFIHFDIEADFIVFRPNVGCSLKGVVNKVGKDHIGCLIHNCFNASMSKPRSTAVNLSEVKPGVELEFEVTGLSNNSRIFSVRGSLKPGSLKNLMKTAAAIPQDSINGNQSVDEIQEVLSAPKGNKKRKISHEQSRADNLEEREVNLSDDLFSDSKPKKKKRKHKELSKSTDTDVIPKTPSTSFENEGISKKKKRKKEVSLDRSSIESMLSTSSIMDSGVDISVVGSDTSVKVEKHLKKERDTTENSELTIQENTTYPTKKHKHKKKSKIKTEVM